jgi:hypothetical protein
MVTFKLLAPIATSLAATLTAAAALSGVAAAAPVDDLIEDVTGGRELLVRPGLCPGPDCPEIAPQAQGLRVVYLAFDGVTLTRSQDNDSATITTASSDGLSAIVNSATEVIPPFDPDDLSWDGGLSRSQIIAQVVDELYEIHAPYNVEFVTTRPTSGTYSMVVFGGTCQSVVGQSNCAGIALLDCDDWMPANITFVFPYGIALGDLATTASQEAAHAFGLGHTDNEDDVMYPYIIPNQYPRDFLQGNVPDDSSCPYDNPIQYQDSDEMMLDTIGPRGQDTTGPSVEITSPTAGATVSAGDPVTATATDAGGVDRTEFQVDGTTIATDTSAPYTFTLPDDLAAGDHLLTVRAYDQADNSSYDRISVYVATGEEMDCDEDSDCAEGEECNGNLCVPDNGLAGDLGDNCASNEDCQSNQCGMGGSGNHCTQPCDEENACPGGFECITGDLCWPSDGDGGGDGGLCAVSRKQGLGGALASLALIAMAMMIGSRRRR